METRPFFGSLTILVFKTMVVSHVPIYVVSDDNPLPTKKTSLLENEKMESKYIY